jgi:hypothetical protein
VAVMSEVPYASPKGTATEMADIWGDLNAFDRSFFPDQSNNAASSGFTPFFANQLSELEGNAPTAPMSSMDNLFASLDSNVDVDMGNMPPVAFGGNDPLPDLFSFPLSTPGTTALPTPTSGGGSQNRSPTISQPCSCLSRALGMMRRLSELMSSTTDVTTQIANIQNTLQQNKTAIDATTEMLKCPGRHDAYLLIIICLTAFRAMELFSAILPEASNLQHIQSPDRRRMSTDSGVDAIHGDGYRIGGDDWARQATQAILSELHSVRRLTKLLSEKLRIQTLATAPAQTNTAVSSKTSSSLSTTTSGSMSTSSGSLPTMSGSLSTTSSGVSDAPVAVKDGAGIENLPRMPFSAEVYSQLELDLSTRVKALSQQVIHRLRNL